jgi:hypothetical protein
LRQRNTGFLGSGIGKRAMRIARFEAALDRMARSLQGSWTEVAHRFGYYDQMHMVLPIHGAPPHAATCGK